jgi:hypothetical protein
MVANNDF